jgi:myo-inositol-1(or 4)-monophosphatase
MLEAAREAALKAGEITLSFRGKSLGTIEKGRIGDFATKADLASERAILEILQKSFPKHSFKSEEIGLIDNGSEYLWVIDPLDGTIVFKSGLPFYAISIGLLKDMRPILGVINLPGMRSLYWANKGKGAYLNGDPIKVSEESDLKKSLICAELGYEKDRKAVITKSLLPLTLKSRYTPIFGCTAFDLALVASNVLEGCVHTAYPWDFAAGAILVEEAGGQVTDQKGKPVDWSKDWMDVFASNGLIHNEVLSIIQQ